MSDRLGPLRAPTIALHSKDDMRIPPDMGRALASGIPDAQVVPLVRGRRGATLPAGGADDRA